MSGDEIFDIEVRPASDEAIFLTDRWGEPIGTFPDVNDWERLVKAGVKVADIEASMIGMGEIFQEEVSFIVQPEGLKGAANLHLFIEFEFAEGLQPDAPLTADLGPNGLAAWRDTLAFHAPALLHVARGLRRLGLEARPIFDTEAIYRGSKVVQLPLPVSTETFFAVHGLLFEDELPFPPSRHAQLAALAQIRWRHDPAKIPEAALPGPARPFATAAAAS